MGQVVMFAGSKVGTGKTTATIMAALAAHQLFKQRVLVIDATTTLKATQIFKQIFNVEPTSTLQTGLAVKNLTKVVTSVQDGFDFIAGTPTLEGYFSAAMEAAGTTKTARTLGLMPNLMALLQEHYDYIFIDSDAEFAAVMDNCLASANYVVVMQPVGKAGFDATDKLFYYLKQLKQELPTVKAAIIGHLAVDFTETAPFYQVEPASSFDVVDAFRTVITRNEWLAEAEPFAANATHNTVARQIASAMYGEVFNELRVRIALQRQLGKFATSAGLTKQGQAVDLFA